MGRHKRGKNMRKRTWERGEANHQEKARDKGDRKSLCHHFGLESALGYGAGAGGGRGVRSASSWATWKLPSKFWSICTWALRELRQTVNLNKIRARTQESKAKTRAETLKVVLVEYISAKRSNEKYSLLAIRYFNREKSKPVLPWNSYLFNSDSLLYRL